MSKLTNYDAGYDEGAWEAFSEATGIGQQPEQKRRAAWWWFGGAGLLMVLGLVVFGRGEKYEVGSGEREAGSRNTQVKIDPSLRGGTTKQSPHMKNEAESTLASRFDQKNKWTKSCDPIELEKKAFTPMQPKKAKPAGPNLSTREAKKQSIKNKLQNGVNTGWLPTDKSVVVERIIKSENKEQAVAEIPQPDKVETTAMPEPKIVDSIVPPTSFKKRRASASPIFYIQTLGTAGIGSLGMKALTIPTVPINNHSRDFTASYLGGYGIAFGGMLSKNVSVETGLSAHRYSENYSNSYTERVTWLTTSSYTTLKMDTSSGKIGMAPVVVTTKHDSLVQHTDQSRNIYSYVQVPLALQYSINILPKLKVMFGGGVCLNRMQLKDRNSNTLYGYDPTGNFQQHKTFWSFSANTGIEWSLFRHCSIVFIPGVSFGRKEDGSHHTKVTQTTISTGIRIYSWSK